MTISALARRYGLSRSTLLYYDSIGLLRPSARSPSDYRLYDEADRDRLEQICRLREAGLELKEIGRILDGPSGGVAGILERRLVALNREIGELREQQRVLVGLLRHPDAIGQARSLDKNGWIAVLRASGLDDAAMRRWHVAFETHAPEAHQDFLESLGIAPAEIEEIRVWSRRGARRSERE